MMRNYKLSEFPDPVPFMHIRCGDDILGKLDEAGLAGEKIRFAEVLCEGPLRHAADDGRRQRERASYLAHRFLMPYVEMHRELTGQDWRVMQSARYDETVLWFEADLFDQMILVYLLQRLARVREATTISLICIGDFAGVERFIGLGQLSAEQLATLFPGRVPVTRRQFSLARKTWAALHARFPRDLNRISRMRSRALPFLPAALRRYLAEYPSTRNGLSQTEQLALEVIAEGASTAEQAFLAVQQREPRPFMGDSMFFAVLRDLAAGEYPVLAGSRKNLHRLPDAELRACQLWVTPLGKRILANKADWFELTETGRWMGGVLVRGPAPRWRWDPKRERLVEQRRAMRKEGRTQRLGRRKPTRAKRRGSRRRQRSRALPAAGSVGRARRGHSRSGR